jgi:hypothetical protein
MLILFVISGVSAQMTVSGILDSTIAVNAGAGDSPDFSNGFEQFANIRFRSRVRDRATVDGAVNLFAAAGDYAVGLAAMGYNPVGENFVAGFELERLFFRLNGEHTDFDGGLMRLPFGYGQVWGPSDFLNPKNPLKPDARPRAVLGMGLTWFPHDDLKLFAFAAAPRNPFAQDAGGMFTGLSMDRHWSKASLQALYSFETPVKADETAAGTKHGIHRTGFSLKLDVEVGIVMDVLYTYNHEEKTELDGLSFSMGIDYSFFDGNLIAMAEYLYNGKTSSTAFGYGGSFLNNHYLYTGFTWVFNSFTNISLALISGLDDISFTPVVSFNHDLFQGATFTILAQVPLDRDLFTGDGNKGEFGPRFSYFNCTARIRLRF